MAMPRKLKDMNLFNEGESYLGQVASVTLPKLTRKMESWRGGGMGGPVKVDQGMGDDGLVLEWNLGGLDHIALRQYGVMSLGGVGLRFAGAYQRDDDEAIDAVEVVVRGRHEEIDFGESKPGEETEQKIKSNLVYYKLTINGRVEAEIDLMAGTEIIGGVDRRAEVRRAIGAG